MLIKGNVFRCESQYIPDLTENTWPDPWISDTYYGEDTLLHETPGLLIEFLHENLV